MTTSPLVSIIIPVHGNAGVTGKCLDTLVKQSFTSCSVEIIVVDDGSSDASPLLLTEYGESIKVVTRAQNGGFARACNDGAERASGEFLVMLNNDTVPLDGWLDSMLACQIQTGASVVGAKLLFHDATVQHAGVIICSDRNPRHIYAGFPSDHPAVGKSRSFQAVTGACALFTRNAFTLAKGFDAGFQNGLEDVDLCLRLAELGHSVHYCHEAVLYHFESVSRGRNSAQIKANGDRFRERWAHKLHIDEFDYYAADGLLKIGRRDVYPLQLRVAAELGEGIVEPSGRGIKTEHRANHALDLMREVVRLTAHIANREVQKHFSTALTSPSPEGITVKKQTSPPESILAQAREIEAAIFDLQAQVATSCVSDANHEHALTFKPSKYLGYRTLVREIRAVVEREIPAGATVLVLSRGDDELLNVSERHVLHFPQTADGTYAGHYPVNSEAVLGHLQTLFDAGARYLVVPCTALWWLKHYEGLESALMTRFGAGRSETPACTIFSLAGAAASVADGASA